MKIFQGENPSVLYVELINELMGSGEEVCPRGQKIKEIRPASIEYLNPLKRVTFMRGRRFNPFFSIAESLWILSGRSDVAFLDLFNKNMSSFSDDGKSFNASYGERIRFFGKNDLHKEIHNPVDQLEDVYIKLKADNDTRQAVIVISNPHFDNASYTIGEKGRDIACNLIITFKIRDERLNMCVFNRSNDVIWGTFTNLIQFSTIQEMLATWLNIEVGTYHQITDSLHIYTETYGARGNQAIFDSHEGIETGDYLVWDRDDCEETIWWNFKDEPRMEMNKEITLMFFEFFWNSIAPKLADDEFIATKGLELLDVIHSDGDYLELTDNYWRMAISSMVAYRFIRLKDYYNAMRVLNDYVPNCSWKVSEVYFLKTLLEKNGLDGEEQELYETIVEDLAVDVLNDRESLQKYLDLEIATN